MIDLKKKVVRVVQKLCKSCARNITQMKKKNDIYTIHTYEVDLPRKCHSI